MYDDILAWVNQVRVRRGQPTLAQLPKGTPRVPNCCVLAEALRGTTEVEVYPSIGGGHVYYGEHDNVEGELFDSFVFEDLPDYVSLFALAFDAGEIPELEA